MRIFCSFCLLWQYISTDLLYQEKTQIQVETKYIYMYNSDLLYVKIKQFQNSTEKKILSRLGITPSTTLTWTSVLSLRNDKKIKPFIAPHIKAECHDLNKSEYTRDRACIILQNYFRKNLGLVGTMGQECTSIICYKKTS